MSQYNFFDLPTITFRATKMHLRVDMQEKDYDLTYESDQFHHSLCDPPEKFPYAPVALQLMARIWKMR